MNVKFFLDTNLFVYSFDSESPDKQKRAQSIIQHALDTKLGCISTQVIQEFANVALKKFSKPMKVSDLNVYVREILFPLCSVFTRFDLLEKSLEVTEKYKFSFYDSMIVSAAIFSQSSILFSEDLNDNQKVEGVKIMNPFRKKMGSFFSN